MVRFLKWPYIYFSEATVDDRGPGTSCLNEYEVEDLARGKLSHEIEQRCQAHLLWCASCQIRVNEEVEFAQAVRTAAALIEEQQRSTAPQGQQSGRIQTNYNRFHDWMRDLAGARFPTRWTAVALSAFALTALAILVPLGRTSDVVVLRSERGSAVAAIAESHAGANLSLRIDVSDVVPYPAYRVSVVDSIGQTIESSDVSPSVGNASVTLHRRLAPGGYWIRLSAPDGHLLREYALHVRL